jgi:hypothetical protein
VHHSRAAQFYGLFSWLYVIHAALL